MKKLIIVGNTAFAEIAYEYFSYDSDYEVIGFCVERSYINEESLLGLPVVTFEDVEKNFSPSEHDVFVAVTYTQLNRLRRRLLNTAKHKGYAPASYVSSKAFVWKNAKLGEHCFVFENNTVQPFVEIGNNVVLWSGNHIGHHSKIGDDCFVSSQVVISGYCSVGNSSFIGVNASLANNINLGRDNWISPGARILKSTGDNMIYKADMSSASSISTRRFFKISDA